MSKAYQNTDWITGHRIAALDSIILSQKAKAQYFIMNVSAVNNHQIYDSWKRLYMFY